MYEDTQGRAVSLIIIGVYIGVAATLAFKAYERHQSNSFSHFHDIEDRLFRLENPDELKDLQDATES